MWQKEAFEAFLGLKSERLREVVELCFPTIPIRVASLVPTGWVNYVLEVNDELIFRFPRRKEGIAQLQIESKLLPIVAKIVSIRVPEFEWLWKGGRGLQRIFVGYRKIPGVHMTRDLLDASKDSRMTLELSDFMNEIHRIPARRLRNLGLPTFTPAEWRRGQGRLLRMIASKVRPLLNAKAQQRLSSIIEDFRNHGDDFRFKHGLIHCDLDGANILCDPSVKRITGIIDWGDACIGDPAYDFSGLLYEYGTKFLDGVLSHYSMEDKSAFKRRVSFYSSLIPFRIILGARKYRRKFRLAGDEVIIFEGQRSIHFSLMKHASALTITHEKEPKLGY